MYHQPGQKDQSDRRTPTTNSSLKGVATYAFEADAAPLELKQNRETAMTQGSGIVAQQGGVFHLKPHNLVGHTSSVTTVALSLDGSIAVSGCGSDSKQNCDKALRVWNMKTGNCEQVLNGHIFWSVSSNLEYEDGYL